MKFHVSLEYPYGSSSHQQFLLAWQVLGVPILDDSMAHGSDSCGLWVAKTQEDLTQFMSESQSVRENYDWETLNEMLSNHPNVLHFYMDWKEGLLEYHQTNIERMKQWGIDVYEDGLQDVYVVERKECSDVEWPSDTLEDIQTALLSGDPVEYFRALLILRKSTQKSDISQILLEGVYYDGTKFQVDQHSVLISLSERMQTSTILALLGQLTVEEQRTVLHRSEESRTSTSEELTQGAAVEDQILHALRTFNDTLQGDKGTIKPIKKLVLNHYDFIPEDIQHIHDIESLTLNRFEMSNLLDVVNRNITRSRVDSFSLSPFVAKLPKLRFLSIAHNEMYDIPSALKTSTITELDLRNCTARYIQHTVNEMTQLRVLHLPASYGQISERLVHLEFLNINDHRLTELPEYIRKLPNLAYLDVSGCGLKSLPEWIGELGLWGLKIGGNYLQMLPTSLEQCSQLVYLDLTDSSWAFNADQSEVKIGLDIQEMSTTLIEKLWRLQLYAEQANALFDSITSNSVEDIEKDRRLKIIQGTRLSDLILLTQHYQAFWRSRDYNRLDLNKQQDLFTDLHQRYIRNQIVLDHNYHAIAYTLLNMRRRSLNGESKTELRAEWLSSQEALDKVAELQELMGSLL